MLGSPVQIAYAVPDAAAAADVWARRHGVGPFLIRSHIELASVRYRGEPAEFDHTSAYGQWGDVMIELVQDHGDGPSVVRDRFGPEDSGLHHLAFIVEDLDAATDELTAEGYEVTMVARTVGGTEFRFVDTWSDLGHDIELYADTPRLRDFYARVRAGAH